MRPLELDQFRSMACTRSGGRPNGIEISIRVWKPPRAAEDHQPVACHDDIAASQRRVVEEPRPSRSNPGFDHLRMNGKTRLSGKGFISCSRQVHPLQPSGPAARTERRAAFENGGTGLLRQSRPSGESQDRQAPETGQACVSRHFVRMHRPSRHSLSANAMPPASFRSGFGWGGNSACGNRRAIIRNNRPGRAQPPHLAAIDPQQAVAEVA
jgi:hypothetical protein